MRRRRLTWTKNADSALPNEGESHPADQGQQQAEKYLIDNDGNGVGSEPSDFAEDVHKGPYPNGAAPALPNEGYDHPASVKQAARDIRASVERKAAKCIRIAQSTLGKTATVGQIEDQALAFMDMADEQLDATLARLSEEQEEPTANFYAEEDGELEEMMANFMAEEDLEAEEMLAQMLADQNDPTHFESNVAEEIAPEPQAEPVAMQEPVSESVELADQEMDALGLMGEEEMTAEDEDLLASIFGGRFAADEEEAEEKEEEKEEEEAEEKESSKKASYKLKPRARKTSTGVKSVGNVSKTAKSEMSELSKLWESAPDISDIF